MAVDRRRAVRRIASALRSRRLAIWLLIGILVYATILTVLKIPMPYSNPLFIAAVVALTLSTGACAWERTVAAAKSSPRELLSRAWRQEGGAGRATFSLAVADAGPERASGAARDAFAAAGLRCHATETGVVGWSNAWSRWASPVFHWSLVLLFVLAGLGQLMSAEGLMNIVVGRSAVDEPSSYALGSPTGPLFLGRYTGIVIGVPEIRLGLKVGGVDRGDSPLVTVSSGGREVRRGYVYPNSPAGWGPLTIHREAIGPAILTTFRFPNGQIQDSVPVLIPTVKSGALPTTATLDITRPQPEGKAVLEFEKIPGKRVVARVRDAGFESPPLAEGQSFDLPDGTKVTIDKLTYYARLRVVNDWTAAPVLAVGVLVVIAPLVSVLWPARRAVAWVVPEEDAAPGQRPGRGMLAVRVAARRSDPAFADRLRTVLADHLRSPDPDAVPDPAHDQAKEM